MAKKRTVYNAIFYTILVGFFMMFAASCSSGPQTRKRCYRYSSYGNGTGNRNYGAYQQYETNCE
ncbi:MAG: hypothetical protein HC836_45115 [Richelia sp. RM2_1_2]|nr:hypothetical protein [Richelia sp. RM2_1_2]